MASSAVLLGKCGSEKCLLDTVAADWANVPGNSGPVAGDDVDWAGRAVAYDSCRLNRPLEQFAAIVRVGATVELDPACPRLSDGGDGTVDEVRDNAELAQLGVIRAFFYLHPPASGRPPDGLPLPAFDPVTRKYAQSSQRMFAVVRRFANETDADEEAITEHRLIYYTIRRLAVQDVHVGGAAGVGAPTQRVLAPLVVLPLSVVLRAVRVFPLEWPRAPVSAEALENAAACRSTARDASHAVLVFWPPTRQIFLPMSTLPLGAEGADEAEAVQRGGADSEWDVPVD